jgi:pleiotropic regulator 1
VIRHYHGHLSGVYALALHPTLDILCTGGRDSVCRVWDMRTKVQIHCLSGHDETVCSILTQGTDPQVRLRTAQHPCVSVCPSSAARVLQAIALAAAAASGC